MLVDSLTYSFPSKVSRSKGRHKGAAANCEQMSANAQHSRQAQGVRLNQWAIPFATSRRRLEPIPRHRSQ